MQKLDRKYTSRKALIYARVSSMEQKENSDGSIAHQRGQVEHAIRLGWPREHTEMLDGDLGKSGTAVVRRCEYQDARRRIQDGEVGGIFASEISRLGRNALELLALIQDCKDTDTLIVLDGSIADPNNPDGNLYQKMMALWAEHENDRRTDRMSKARIAKAKQGKAVSGPPTGYVADRDGEWIFDPDQRIYDSVAAIFRIFPEARSLKKTVDSMNDLGIEIWMRRGALLTPRKPTVSIVARILHNPSYKGWYVYPQRKVDHRAGLTEGGFIRIRKAEPEEMTITPNHHPPYVSPEQWDENLRILERNAPSREGRSIGDGPALVQGRIRCGAHDLAMSARHLRTLSDGSVSYAYQCMGTYLSGGEQCGYVTGLHLDRELTAALLQRLSTPEIATLKQTWDSARRNAHSEERRRTGALRQATARVDDAKARLLSLPSDRPHVVDAYEAEFESAMQRLKEIQNRLDGQPSIIETFTEEAWQDLLELADNIGAIWNAATTENSDRKELARMVIDKVIIEEKIRRGRVTERLVVRVIWADGEDDTILKVRLAPVAHQMIAEMAADKVDPADITQHLNAEGLRTTQGNLWTRDTVAHHVRALQKKAG